MGRTLEVGADGTVAAGDAAGAAAALAGGQVLDRSASTGSIRAARSAG
jgi:hypothetical protein